MDQPHRGRRTVNIDLVARQLNSHRLLCVRLSPGWRWTGLVIKEPLRG